MSNLENFLTAWREWSPPSAPNTQYRCYHDAQGRPLQYTTEHLPGTWIEVNAKEFSLASRHMRVRDGRLIPWRSEIRQKLCPGSAGTACAIAHVAITVPETEPYQRWHTRTYD